MSKLYIEKNGLKIPVAELESIASKEQAVIGNAERDLILRTAGNIKIQVGNKFYDLPITTTDVQGGGSGTIINGAKVIIIDTISDLTGLTYPGEGSFVYVRDSEDFYIAVSDTYILLTDSKEQLNKIYLSYIDSQDLTGEQKYIAIKNTGLVIDTIQNVGNFDTSDIYENQVVFALAEGKHYQLTDVNNPTLTESWKELYLSLTGGTLTGDVYLDKSKLHLKPEYLKDFLPINESDYDAFFIGDDNYENGLGIWKTTNNIIFSAQGVGSFGYKFLTKGGTAGYLNPLSISNNNVSIAGPIDYNYAFSVNGESVFKNTAYYLNGLSSNNFVTGINGSGFAISIDTLGKYTLEIDKLLLRNATTDTDQQYKSRGLDGSLIFNNSYNIVTADPVESIDIVISGSKAGRYSDTSGTIMKLTDKSRYATVTRTPIANLYDEAPAKVTELIQLGFGIGDKTPTGATVGYTTYGKQTDGVYATIPGTVIVDIINVFQITVNSSSASLVVGDLLFYKEWDANKNQIRAVYAEVVSIASGFVYVYCYNRSELQEGDTLIKLGNRLTQESFMHMNSSDEHTPFLESANNIDSFNDFLENWYYDAFENETTKDRENNTLRKEQVRVKQGLLYGITDVDLGLLPAEQTGLYSDNAYIKGKFQANNRFMLNDILVWDGITLNLPGYVKETRKLTINGVQYDLSADRSWTIEGGSGGSGTVTSVGMTVPTGFSIGNSPITTAGDLALTFLAGYSLPTTANQTNWSTAYGWGNHALAGYIKTYTETDPTVGSHIKAITTTNISNWNTAYGWGNHATQGYIKIYTETDPTVPSHVKAITTTNISNWNSAFSWGNHALAGYVPQARTITINGTTFDLSANRSWTVAASGGVELWEQDANNLYPLTVNKQFYYYVNRPNGAAAALFFNTGTNGQGIIVEADTLAGDFQGNHATLEALRASNNAGGPIATFSGNTNTVIINNTGTISGYAPTQPNHLTTKQYVDTLVGNGGGGSVVSVGLTAPTGFTVGNTPITTTGNLNLTFASGYSLPTNARQVQWDTAYGWGNHAGKYPLYNGTGAFGTWGIDITGNSEYTNRMQFVAGLDALNYAFYGGLIQNSTTGPTDGTWFNKLKILHNNPAGYFTELAQSFTGTEGLWHRRMVAGTLGTWKRVLDTANFNESAPTLTGGNASGTWGINISGTAANATLWNNQTYNSTAKTAIDTYIMAYQGGSWGPTGAAAVKTFLGLPTDLNAYHRELGTFGVDANTMQSNSSAFTYAVNAPQNGPIIHFGAGGYGLQLNANYGDGTSIHFRTRNGDTPAWNSWKYILTQTFGGGMVVFNGGSGTGYTTANLQLMRTGTGNAPILSFHHSGVVASSISVQPSGTISFINNPGTGYESIIARDITATGLMVGAGIGVSQTTGAGAGISLYGTPTTTIPTYGLMFAQTSNFATYGPVSGDWATYFTMGGAVSRGWIFRRDSTNIASISAQGEAMFQLGGTFGGAVRSTGTEYTSSAVRYWSWSASIGAAESGSEVGPNSNINMYLQRWAANGTYIGIAMEVKRQTGNVYFGNQIYAAGGGFTGVVAGVTPTAANHLTTKQYVDGLVGSGGVWKRTFIGADYRLVPTNDFDGIMINKATNGAAIEIDANCMGIRSFSQNYTAGTFVNNDSSAPTVSILNNNSNANARMTLWTGGSNFLDVAWITIDGTFTSRGGYVDISDIRLKNILTYVRPEVQNIKAIRYTLKEGSDRIRYGYSAQEVQEFMPEAVNTSVDGMLSVNYAQVHTAKIQRLEEEVKQLKDKLYGVGGH